MIDKGWKCLCWRMMVATWNPPPSSAKDINYTTTKHINQLSSSNLSASLKPTKTWCHFPQLPWHNQLQTWVPLPWCALLPIDGFGWNTCSYLGAWCTTDRFFAMCNGAHRSTDDSRVSINSWTPIIWLIKDLSKWEARVAPFGHPPSMPGLARLVQLMERILSMWHACLCMLDTALIIHVRL